MAEQHRVRLTIRPDEEIEVGDAELLDLQRMGLIAKGKAPSKPAAAPKPSTAPAADSKREN